LFLDPYAKLRLIDFLVPFLGQYRPLWQGLGTAAFDLLIVIIVTSLLRQRLGLKAFRLVHWATYALWPVAMAHAIGNGTDAHRIWFLSFAGVCALIVALSVWWRMRANFTEYADA
jgi:predicted ferric reductase